MVGWHHRLDGHGFGWTPGHGDRQGGLACCSSRGRKESDMTLRLNLYREDFIVTEISQEEKSHYPVISFTCEV